MSVACVITRAGASEDAPRAFLAPGSIIAMLQDDHVVAYPQLTLDRHAARVLSPENALEVCAFLNRALQPGQRPFAVSIAGGGG